jgi:acyl dehydratase
VISATFGALVRSGLFAEGGQGAPGIDELRWLAPVRPGDRAAISVHIDAVRASETRPDRGYVTMRFEIRNQVDQLVTVYRCREIYRRRATPA